MTPLTLVPKWAAKKLKPTANPHMSTPDYALLRQRAQHPDDPLFQPAVRTLFAAPVSSDTVYFYDRPIEAASFVAELRAAADQFEAEMARYTADGDHYHVLHAKYVEEWIELFLSRMEISHASKERREPLKLKGDFEEYRSLVIGAVEDVPSAAPAQTAADRETAGPSV